MGNICEDVKRHGKAGLQEVLKHVELTEQEHNNPSKHRDKVLDKMANASSLDIHKLFEGFIGPVKEKCSHDSDWQAVNEMMKTADNKRKMGLPLSEAEVMSTAFQLLTQAKLFTTMNATYILAPSVHELLFGSFDSPFKIYDHQIPSDAPTMDAVPEAGLITADPLTDRFSQTKAFKHAKRVDLTRETLLTDRTGQVVEQANQLGTSLKYREDELAAKAFQDQSNASLFTAAPLEADAGAYFPERVNVPLYRTAAGTTKPNYEAVINKTSSNFLIQWDSIAQAIRLLRQMKNLKNQFIQTINGPLRIVVPFGLEQRAKLLAAAGTGAEVRGLGLAGGAATNTDFSVFHAPDWIKKMGVPSIEVIVWDLLDPGNPASQSVWYACGDSQKQFRKQKRWGAEFNVATQAQLGGEDFRRDILMSARATANVGFRSVDDKYVIQCA